jgi:hypothetical protein
VHWYGVLVADEDRASELIRKMNAELRGDAEYQVAQRDAARLWALYDEARAHTSGVEDFRARVDAGLQEFIRRVDVVLSTSAVGHGVSISRTVGSLEEARQLLERGDTAEIIAVALEITADPASAEALDEASAKLRKAGAANLNPNVLLMIVLVLITLALSIGQAELPGKVQTITTDWATSLALALAITDHIKRNRSP